MTVLENTAEALLISCQKEGPMTEGNTASMWGVTPDGVKLIAAGMDVYDLCDTVITVRYEALGFVCTGWAAPLSPQGDVDMPPSQNPERRRVWLSTLYDGKDQAEAIGFEDDGSRLVSSNDGSGTLADALKDAFDRMVLLSQFA